jgi:predicted permease
VINESLAALYWPGADPIGQRLLLGGGAGPGWVTVVGVVGDVRQSGLDAEPRPEYYLPHAQFTFWNDGGPVRSMSVVLRTAGDPMAVAGPAREEIRALDPNLPVAELRTLDEVRSASAAQPRFLSLLLGVFSAMALLLAAVGIYGTLSYLVAQRTREFGIRMALGARASEIMRMVVRRGAALTVSGLAVGIAAALLLTRLLAGLLYGVTTTDAVTYAAAPAVLLAVALLACWLPARRATRVDPMVALRGE